MTAFHVWSFVGTFLAGAATAIFAEPVRQLLFRPKIHASFDKTTCVVHWAGSPGVSEGFSIRVQVRTTTTWGNKVATGCRAYLVGMEIERGGVFESTGFVDSLQLSWSSRGEAPNQLAIDIPKDVSQFVQLFSTIAAVPDKFETHTVLMPHYCKHLFDNTPKKLRLTVLASSETAPPSMTHFVFEWHGQWDTFQTFSETAP